MIASRRSSLACCRVISRPSPDPCLPVLRIGQSGGHPIPPAQLLSTPSGAVFDGIDLLCLDDDPMHFLRQPLSAPVGVDRGVRRNLGAIDRDSAEPGQTKWPAIIRT